MRENSKVLGAVERTTPPAFKAVATVTQAAPVQNTYYTLFEKYNVQIHGLALLIAAAGETLNAKITIDGVVITGSSIAVNAGEYTNCSSAMRFTGGTLTIPFGASNANADCNVANLQLKGRHVKIEMRKTTAAGAGNLTGYVVYSQW